MTDAREVGAVATLTATRLDLFQDFAPAGDESDPLALIRGRRVRDADQGSLGQRDEQARALVDADDLGGPRVAHTLRDEDLQRALLIGYTIFDLAGHALLSKRSAYRTGYRHPGASLEDGQLPCLSMLVHSGARPTVPMETTRTGGTHLDVFRRAWSEAELSPQRSGP
jgi:hypothetical protein